MQIPIDQLSQMARAVIWEALSYADAPIVITSIGWNPGGRLQAVFECEIPYGNNTCEHLVQVEISQVDGDRIHGKLIKPASPTGLTLIFSPLSTWAYKKMYR